MKATQVRHGEVVLVLSKEGEEKNNVIGYHEGAVFYTLGERHGFTITKKTPTDGAYYIVGKDIKKNILFVSQKSARSCLAETCLAENKIDLKNTNWIINTPDSKKTYTTQIRYHGEFLSCKIICQSKALAKVIFTKSILVASGQSCVIYDDDICLGGGVVV